jgi:predicted dehydrogenase
MKRLIEAGAIGDITHVLAEAYGPVVLRAKRQTWRSDKAEGGGCLYDYAAHPLNLLNWFFGVPARVSGSVMNSVFSEGIDDEVFSTLQWDAGPTAHLSVNWSDESHRKMSTKISLIGTNGRLYADRQECQAYLRTPVAALPDYTEGWNVKYTTELTEDRWFYLRGEEYSAQLDEFVTAIRAGKTDATENSFASATDTDKTLAMIIENAETGNAVGEAPEKRQAEKPAKKRWFGR